MATITVRSGDYAGPGVAALPRPAPKRLSWPLNLLLLYIAAITIFGKGPTYIGVEPLFWGEIVMLVSVAWAFRNWNRVLFRGPAAHTVTALICGFLVLGAIETSFDYSIWGLDALRDSAVWYYSVFYFVGAAIASDRDDWNVFSERWKLFFLVTVPWGVVEVASDFRISRLSPSFGSRNFPILASSSIELVQNLGLGCCLLLIGSNLPVKALRRIVVLILVVTTGLAVTASAHPRGPRLAVLAALLVLMALSFSQTSGRAFRRKLAIVSVLLFIGLMGAIAAGADVIASLNADRFEAASIEDEDDTASWRTDWWRHLYDAVMAQNPTTGLGFGDPLAEYGPGANADSPAPLRAPHNFNMTIFARMGIVGALIWSGILLFGIGVPLWRMLIASTPAAREESRQRSFWFAVLVAMWVDASFEVLMEGPVMAIPFWLLLGIMSARPRLGTVRVVSYLKPRPRELPPNDIVQVR